MDLEQREQEGLWQGPRRRVRSQCSRKDPSAEAHRAEMNEDVEVSTQPGLQGTQVEFQGRETKGRLTETSKGPRGGSAEELRIIGTNSLCDHIQITSQPLSLVFLIYAVNERVDEVRS